VPAHRYHRHSDATRVLAVLSENEWENLTDEDVDLLVATAAAS
jgi:hypothetical protein